MYNFFIFNFIKLIGVYSYIFINTDKLNLITRLMTGLWVPGMLLHIAEYYYINLLCLYSRLFLLILNTVEFLYSPFENYINFICINLDILLLEFLYNSTDVYYIISQWYVNSGCYIKYLLNLIKYFLTLFLDFIYVCYNKKQRKQLFKYSFQNLFNFWLLENGYNYITQNSTYRLLHKRYIQSSTMSNLHPWYVTGLSDAESSFIIKISTDKRSKTGWRIDPVFEIGLNEKDGALLEKVQQYFGVGKIRKNKGNNAEILAVQSVKDLYNVIIPHFDKHLLITKKQADFLLFKQVITMMVNKQHLTLSGLQSIVNIRASMNKGLTTQLYNAFPNTVPVPRAEVDFGTIPDPNWFAGFVEGEGSFIIFVKDSPKYALGKSISLNFSVCQHIRDSVLIKSLPEYLNCGSTIVRNDRDIADYFINRFKDHQEKVIPFFDKYKLHGLKLLKFNAFKKAAAIIENKDHLTIEGIQQIQQIKDDLNKII